MKKQENRWAVDGKNYERVNYPRTFSNLSSRAGNCLIWLGILNKKDARTAIKTRRLHPKNRETKNCGWKTYCEIAKWAGLPEPKLKTKFPPIKVKRGQDYNPQKCPHCGKLLD